MWNKFYCKSWWFGLKVLGITLLAFCPIIVGLIKSNSLKQSQIKIEKIIELINWIIIEIKYKKTDIYSMLNILSFEENFKNLEFLQYFKNKSNLKPFPKAWKTAIENWNCTIPKHEKNLLKSLSNILGTTDSNGQIFSLKHLKLRFEESLEHAKSLYIKQGKISRCLGTLFGIAIFIIFI